MKKLTYVFSTFIAVFLLLGTVSLNAQTEVTEWGLSAEYNTLWPILNDGTTPAGNASMGGEVMSGWRGLQGGFAELTITTMQALVVKGQIEFAGGAPTANAYTPLRYALTWQDSNTTLMYALTDSATWSHQGNHFGYGFHPRTGAGGTSNGAGGSGNVWTINNGNWASTWSNNGWPVIKVDQAPRNADMVAGIYDFAISVISIDDTTNEISWYMVEVNNGYWFGGTAQDTANTMKFNSIIFGTDQFEGTAFNVIGMTAELGDPIEVPEAPWEDYYIDQWGLSAEYNTLWPILNDSTTLVGDASMGGEVMSGWRGLQGGFGQDVTISTEVAIIVEGQIAFTGGAPTENAYTPLRYALTWQDSNSTLLNTLTDSATWSHQGNHFGYGFHPRTGAGGTSNGAGGSGNVWTINNGNWASTWSNNGWPVIKVDQEPRNAHMVEGVYDFAISVISIDDTTNEISWYMVEEDNGYWFGGTGQDTAMTKKFNSIIFGTDQFEGTEFKVIAMEVKKGDPVVVPEAPWEAYYVDQWGATNYNYWPIINDSSTLVGDGIMGDGSEPINGSGWASILGGFGQELELKTDEALIVSGEIEFVGTEGGGNSYTPLRYAMTYLDSAVLNDALTDSAEWVGGSGNHSGYGFHPRTGAGGMSNGAGGSGTVWTVNKGNWISTWSNNGGPIAAVNQAPRNAEMIPGTYEFAISVKSIDDTTNEIKWLLIEENNAYWFGGTVVDTATSDKFNSVVFGVNEGDWTQVKILAAEVDYGEIEVPEAPWEDYYIDQWGLSAEYNTLWPILNDSSTLVGDASMGGEVMGGWRALQGGFGQDVTISSEKAIIIEGQIEFAGGAPSENAYTPLRYALTYQDSNSTLVNALTDSATWSHQGNHFGYGFHPRTGAGNMSNGAGGSGTVWTINNGNWASTWSNNGGPIAAVAQIPRNAHLIEGVYDFAVSVHSIDDTTNEIRWYMIEEEESLYWFGGTTQDTATTMKFNSIIFGTDQFDGTAFNVLAMEVKKGDPIDVPEAPFAPFYVGDWGFIGDMTGGWSFTPGEFTGNATMSGASAPTDWAALRGEFDNPSSPNDEVDLVVTGKVELIGGGFENGLRLGLFNSNSAGELIDTTEAETHWNGDDVASGYLFIPRSGENDLPDWSDKGKGSVGTIVNHSWMSTDGSESMVLTDDIPVPIGVVAGEETYDFELSFSKDGELRYYIYNSDKSYQFGSILNVETPPTTTFNGVNVALNTGVTTTAVNLIDVHVDRGDPIEIPDDVVSVGENRGLPTEFALSQNYPNPFNPATTIEFALPLNADVKLTVYDVLGSKVATLVNGQVNAGYHRINFNAGNLASGIYFYNIKANDFISTKKLILLK